MIYIRTVQNFNVCTKMNLEMSATEIRNLRNSGIQNFGNSCNTNIEIPIHESNTLMCSVSRTTLILLLIITPHSHLAIVTNKQTDVPMRKSSLIPTKYDRRNPCPLQTSLSFVGDAACQPRFFGNPTS